MTREKLIRLCIVAGTTVLLDQITKVAIVKLLNYGQTIPVIKGFFNITYVLNPGGAFGIFAQQSQMIRVLVFLVFSILAVGVIMYMYVGVPRSHPMLANAFALILGGAVGNLIDRIRMGKVVDFLDFNLYFMRWPSFNVADSAICIGVAIVAYHFLFNKLPEESRNLL